MARSTNESMRDDLTVERVTNLPELLAVKPEYEQLHLSTGNILPFALHEWHVAWLTHYLNVDPRVHDEFSVFIVRNQARACVAIVPFVASRRRVGPISLMSLDLLGADPSTTETRTPLILKGYEAQVVQSVRQVVAAAHDWDWIAWHAVTSDLGAALAGADHIDSETEAPGYILDLPSTWEEFRTRLKRNIRESLRHCYNSLKRDGHSFQFEVLNEPADVRHGLQRFLELHAMRAHLGGTVEHFDHFSNSIAREFLFDICERLAARDVVRLFQLRINDQIVAARIAFVVNGSLYLYFSGFDPQWARYSVMTTTIAEALKYAIARGLKTLNLTRGTDPSKTRWGPRVVEYQAFVERRSRLSSRLAYRFYVNARTGQSFEARWLRKLARARRAWK